MYERLKIELKEIAAIADGLPERYRERCFDVLLSELLKEESSKDSPFPADPPPLTPEKTPAPPPIPNKPMVVQAKVRAFLTRHGLKEDVLPKILFVEGQEVHFIKEPDKSKVASCQIRWALLLALKNGILKGEMSVDAEEVRSVCIDKGIYDRKNYSSNYKKNAAFFQVSPVPHGPAVKLSDEGEKELANLLTKLSTEVPNGDEG